MLYRVLTRCAVPFLPRLLRVRARRGREDPARIHERYGMASLPRPPGSLVWIHAASVGESLSAIVLIRRLIAASFPVLVTTGTVTSARLMATRLPAGALHQYVPLDTPGYVARFLDHWRPSLALWIESELWPVMLGELKARRVPVILVNGRMSEKSRRTWSHMKGWIRRILSAFVLCLVQDDDEAQRFTSLGAPDVRVPGNLKYAAEPPFVDDYALNAFRAAIGARPVWLMAQTHEGEDSLALDAHIALRSRFPNLLTIIVPRHPVRGPAVRELADRMGLRVASRTTTTGTNGMPDADTAIFIGDSMGEMGLFYRLAPVTCVAGSFTWEGHNPIEVAQNGSAILFGPRMANFAAIARDFINSGAARPVMDADALRVALDHLLSDADARAAMIEAATRLVAGKGGALDATWEAIAPWLPNATGQRSL